MNNLKVRPLEKIVLPAEPHMVGDGFKVHNMIPNGARIALDRMSPFFLLDYNAKMDVTPGGLPKGVGAHPHRGFETVTIAYKGKVAHHDSTGSKGIIEEGDIQWMSAASGVLHKEYYAEEFAESGGVFQMVQLWINLPAKYKMNPPAYQAIINKDIPVYLTDDEKVSVDVIAGAFKSYKGIAHTFSPIEMYNILFLDDAEIVLETYAHYNTALLVIEGEVVINNESLINTDSMGLFANKGELITIKGTKNTKVLFLSGEPLNEPIASYGPFLMNTEEEIVQAFKDLENGKFGQL